MSIIYNDIIDFKVSFKNFITLTFVNALHLNTIRPRDMVTADVPYSCCSSEVQQACVHQSIAGVNHEPEADNQLTISNEGCENKLLDRADRAGQRLLVCLLVISVYQVKICFCKFCIHYRECFV